MEESAFIVNAKSALLRSAGDAMSTHSSISSDVRKPVVSIQVRKSLKQFCYLVTCGQRVDDCWNARFARALQQSCGGFSSSLGGGAESYLRR